MTLKEIEVFVKHFLSRRSIRKTHQQSLAWGIQWYPMISKAHDSTEFAHFHIDQFTLFLTLCSIDISPQIRFLGEFFAIDAKRHVVCLWSSHQLLWCHVEHGQSLVQFVFKSKVALAKNVKTSETYMKYHEISWNIMKYHEIILMKRIRSPFYGLVGCCDSFLKIWLKQGQQDTILQWTPGVVHVFVEVPQADLSIAQQLAFSKSG